LEISDFWDRVPDGHGTIIYDGAATGDLPTANFSFPGIKIGE